MSSAQVKLAPLGGMINNIQAMRGVASLVVFIGHALLLMPGIGLDQYFSFFGVIASGGVDIFFVISGFIITTVAMKSGEDDTQRFRSAWNFGVKRVVRIYPVYWVVFLCALVMSNWVNFAPPVTDIKPIWQQFLLLTHVNSYVMAAWSLAFEVYFYAVVVIAILISPKNVGKVLFVWALVTVGIIFYDYAIGRAGWIGLLPFSPLILEFIMGMGVAWVIRTGFTGFPMAATFIGVVAFMAGSEVMRHLGWSSLNPWYRTFYNGLPSAFIIYGVVALEYRKIWTFSDAWVKLGDASYSIYIWHQFIFYCIYTALVGQAWIHSVNPVLLSCVWLAPALLFGFVSYRSIELPVQRWLNRGLLVNPRGDTKGSWLRRIIYVAGFLVLIGAVFFYGWMKQQQVRTMAADAGAVGQLIAQKNTQSGETEAEFAAATRALGLVEDTQLRGHFDGVYKVPGQIRVHGWATDMAGESDNLKVLVFHCGKYIGVAPRGARRADVADSLGISDTNSGFTVNIDDDTECSSSMVVAVIVGNSRFSTMSGQAVAP